METARRNRIRRVVSELNRQRRLQSRKIDILCKDFVTSHKNFLKQLQIMNLQNQLYESLIGETSLKHVLESAVDAIQHIAKDANTAVWLGSGFEAHVFDEQEFTNEQTDIIENCFNCELAEKIYNSRRCLELQELFELGLPESDLFLKLSIAAIPLQDLYPQEQQGFILLYRPACHPIEPQEIDNLALLIPGISKAVRACQRTAHGKAIT